jgi:circadian clock protein KaiC
LVKEDAQVSDDVNGPGGRRETGIPGLDRILDGGLPIAGVYIVQGPPGAGKTILANQACFHHAKTGGRAVYVTLLAESYSRMFQHLRGMQFFDERAIPDQVYYIGGFRTLQDEGLDALVTLVRGAIQNNATLLVIDGLVSAQESAPSDSVFKKFIHEIQIVAELTRCSVLLLTNAERAAGFFPEHTMVDGVLHLTDELSELRPLRHIRILKLRGGAPVRGLHSLRITSRGIEVRPRIETLLPERLSDDDLAARGGKMALGVAGLDEMLRGGVRTGSVTMLIGSSGSGKTILGMQFLSEGVRNGERVLYFGFYERPAAILAKCERVGLGGLGEGVRNGLARLVWHRPVEGVVDELGQSLIESVREMNAQRVFIDGMQGFERATDFPERLSHVYSAIAQELERLGATTLYTTETRELFGRDIEVPITGLSAATQNIILLRHVEHRAEMRRVLTILKVRDDDYDGRMRELRITDEGIVLTDRFAADSHLVTGGGDPADPSDTPIDTPIDTGK